jgi:hypothetical protein
MQTPWGIAQTIEEIAKGIINVSTASHDGIILTETRIAAMPDYMKNSTFTRNPSAYEEDCDWCMPVLVFEKEFREYYARTRRSNIEFIFDTAKATLRNNQPAAYEKYYGVTLLPGESHARDREAFLAENANKWIVAAAFGDWHADVPKDMVGVCARRPEQTNQNTAPARYFLIPASEYETLAAQGFVIDLARHKEVPPLK